MTLTDPTTTARSTTLRERFVEVRGTTEALAAPLSAEDQQVQSMPDVSPTKWHRAHTTWFFETFLLQPELPGYEAHHPGYGYLFNSYYDAVGARHPRPERGLVTRPFGRARWGRTGGRSTRAMHHARSICLESRSSVRTSSTVVELGHPSRSSSTRSCS